MQTVAFIIYQGMRIHMKVTISDVAKAAGVSVSTVSRVISDSPRISEETKLKVRKVIEELNYHPNAIARSLANQSSKTIGLILNTEAQTLVRNPFFIRAMTGISQYAQENDYNVMFAYNESEDGNIDIAVRYVNSRNVDGIILFTSRTNDKCIDYLVKQGFPFSVIGRPDQTEGVLWVDNDNFQATYQVTDSLISKGHKRIAFLGGPQDHNVSRDRFEGYKAAMTVHGYSIDKNMTFLNGSFSEEFGSECMTKIFSAREKGAELPTAIVTSDDMQALGVLKAMRKMNLSDIAVTGFNNMPISTYRNETFVSVDVNAHKLGFYAAKLLLERIKGRQDLPGHYIVPTSMVEVEPFY